MWRESLIFNFVGGSVGQRLRGLGSRPGREQVFEVLAGYIGEARQY